MYKQIYLVKIILLVDFLSSMTEYGLALNQCFKNQSTLDLCQSLIILLIEPLASLASAQACES